MPAPHSDSGWRPIERRLITSQVLGRDLQIVSGKLFERIRKLLAVAFHAARSADHGRIEKSDAYHSGPTSSITSCHKRWQSDRLAISRQRLREDCNPESATARFLPSGQHAGGLEQP